MKHLLGVPKIMQKSALGVCTTLLCVAGVYAGALQINTERGWDIYTPPASGAGYRYGPSIIIHPDDSISIWTAAPPDGTSGWDSIKYKTSNDGGQTWSAETVALNPTAGSSDALSVCDPAAIYFNGYYYLGYTSTQNTSGLENDVYIARSTSPDSGFEKWNGSGWGGNPQPFIEFTGLSTSWGAGEPSFVVKDDTLYVYYTWLDATRTTRVATASVNDPNWPASLTYQGVAATNNSGGVGDEDSMDVKYIDDYGKFIGITVDDRFSSDSYIHVWESLDGLTFTSASGVSKYTQDWAHNAGISGGLDGHIDLSDNNFIAYAYSPTDGLDWARWATYLNPITISESNKPPKALAGTTVPEPGTGLMLFAGVLAILLLRKPRTQK